MASIAEESIDARKAASFLDCSGNPFWQSFREAFGNTGPLSPATGSLAYVKWKEWEDFIDGMDASGAFDGSVFVPLAGEWHLDGSAYFTQIREKRDWVRALQKSQWQGLFGSPPSWSSENLVGFMVCPVGFALVQYVIFLVHKMRSNLPEDAARLNLESMLFAFVSILDSNFDHLESSNWNVTSFDLAVNLNLDDPKFYRSYAEYIEFVRSKEGIAGISSFPSWQEDWPNFPSESRTLNDLAEGKLRKLPKLRVALVGEHGPSNLEHLAALQEALASPVEARHFFTYLWQLGRPEKREGQKTKQKADQTDEAESENPAMFGVHPSYSSSLRSVQITWDAFWGEPLTESAGRDKSRSKPMWKIHEALWALKEFAHRDVFLRSSVRDGLIICSEPLWLCVLLHAALASKESKGNLMTRASAAGRVMCLLVDFDQIFGLDEVDHFWDLVFDETEKEEMVPGKKEKEGAKEGESIHEAEIFRSWSLRKALQGTPWVFSATSRITAEMLYWQTGLRVPYVPCLSLYISARYQPRKKELLFFRSSLPGAAPFQRVLRLIEAEQREQHAESLKTASPLQIVFMTSPMSFTEIASYQAVAMLPHIPNALRLSDVYSMAIPLFIPDEPLIHKFLWPEDPMPLLSKIRSNASRNSLPISHISPLEFQVAGRRFYQFRHERHYWLQFTEWWLRPHLLHFSRAHSFPRNFHSRCLSISFNFQRWCFLKISFGFFLQVVPEIY